MIGAAPRRPSTSPYSAAAASQSEARDQVVKARDADLPATSEEEPDAAAIGLGEGIVPVDPDWIHTVPAGEACGTFQRYLAELAALGYNPLDAVCPPNGACDDPSNRNTAIPDANTPIKTYALSIHVFCDKRGNNCTTSQATVDAAVATLNTNYASWRIRFIYQTNFIKDDKYRVLDAGEEGMMKHRYADSPATKLNVYVVDAGGLSWGTFPWSSNALTSYGGIVLDQTHIGGALPSILTHEVGHCLGLWHTFHGVDEVTACSDCYEPAGRPPEQGDITGDWCADTAPTPRNNYCTEPGTTDPCSGVAWAPTPISNYMGYSNRCQTEFTPQQAGRMHCWTAAVSGWLK